MKFSICLIFFLFQFHCYGQRVGVDEIDTSKVFPWIEKTISEYGGVYYFGESEMESELILEEKSKKWYATIVSGSFSENGEKWYWSYDSLTNVRIEANQFYSDKTNGEFVVYETDEGRKKGLKVVKPWSNIPLPGEYEIGIKAE